MNLNNFRHKTQIRVRTYEVDAQGIVHNINYLKYIESGRVEYRRQMGYNMLPSGIFNDGLKVVVVRNEIDYISPAFLDELINVYTRISWIKNSSFCFESILEADSTKKLVCQSIGILVNIGSNNKPKKISKKFRNEIKNFESKKLKNVKES